MARGASVNPITSRDLLLSDYFRSPSSRSSTQYVSTEKERTRERGRWMPPPRGPNRIQIHMYNVCVCSGRGLALLFPISKLSPPSLLLPPSRKLHILHLLLPFHRKRMKYAKEARKASIPSSPPPPQKLARRNASQFYSLRGKQRTTYMWRGVSEGCKHYYTHKQLPEPSLNTSETHREEREREKAGCKPPPNLISLGSRAENCICTLLLTSPSAAESSSGGGFNKV